MRFDDIIILLSSVSLLLALGMNGIFPPYTIVTTQGTKGSRWNNNCGVIDQNSTVHEYEFANSEIETQRTQSSRPPGWFNLTFRVPFEIDENWTRVYMRAIFSTGTWGGVIYWWTLKWRCYNDNVVAFSDEWRFSLESSAWRPLMLSRDNIEYNIMQHEPNSSIYTPGQWFFEATLTVHNATIKRGASEYQVYYNLFLEVFQDSSLSERQLILTNSFYQTLIVEATLALILGLHIIRRAKKHQ